MLHVCIKVLLASGWEPCSKGEWIKCCCPREGFCCDNYEPLPEECNHG